jgi:CrcB protein
MARPDDTHPELPLDPDADPERPLHLRPGAVALVASGGFVGTLARYGLSRLDPTHVRTWPWGTFVANILGALVLGVLLEWLARRGVDGGWRRRARLLLGTGFCGALTTYSALAVETDLLVRGHRPGLAVGYLAASVLAGVLATVLGILAAGRAGAQDGPAS